MGKGPEQRINYLGRTVSRRKAIKVGGIAVAGLAFSKPLVDTVRPKPAFADYVSKNGQPSIEWVDDDTGCYLAPGTLSKVSVAYLCDVSDGPAVPFDATVSLVGVLENEGNQVFNVSIDPSSPSWGPDEDQACKAIEFTFEFPNGFDDSHKIKLEFEAEAEGSAPAASPRLTITLL